MDTQAGQDHERAPRPAHTPDALRAALAVVAPTRLPEMQRTKDEAFNHAVAFQSLIPLMCWVYDWARDIEIARRPDLSARYERAQQHLENEDPAAAQKALGEMSAVRREAVRAANVQGPAAPE
ncbi:hypothetical protein ACFWFB_32990 [Streptomyces albidoflavus]